MKTELLRGNGPDGAEAIDRAAELLRAGELVAFPTETVYGLGGLGTSAEAVARVFEAKGRPADNPLILHVSSVEEIDRHARGDSRVRRLAEAFMPGPLTLVLPSRESVPEIARAGLATVAIRIPDHQIALALLEKTGPLVAPSANRSGRPSPTRASHVIDDLGGRIAAVLDGGPCRVGIESTVLDLSGRRPVILRPGLITEDDLAPILGILPDPLHAAEVEKPGAPGMKYRHYAPGVPVELRFVDEGHQALELEYHFNEGETVLLLVSDEFLDEIEPGPEVVVRRLDEESLFAHFREAEKGGVDRIVVLARWGDLSVAMRNRLEKASTGG